MHGPVRVWIMTVRVTTLKGPEAGAYYVERPGKYYLDGDEPPGQWRGAGARTLGLDGELVDDDFVALMAGVDPRTGSELGSRHTPRNVRGFDVTCSAPKSVSVLFAIGDDHTRREVLAAHDAAVEAMVDWVERNAHCRHRVNREVWTVDARGIVAALFRQHTSRALDPQIHTHVVIVNRVPAPDGRWLALDARTIKRDQRTLSALYHAGLRAELTERLGIRWRQPDNGIAEMADIDPRVLDRFSSRTRAVQRVFDRKVDRFVATMERQPTMRERWRLEREAVLQSRPTKTSADAATLHCEWTAQLAGLGVTPEVLVGDVVGRVVSREWFPSGPVEAAAVEALSERQSTWRAAEITREVARAVPTTFAASAPTVVQWVQDMGEDIESDMIIDLSLPAPREVPVRRDGRPVTESVLHRVLTTAEILAQEDEIVIRAQRRIDLPSIDHHNVAGEQLTGVQHEVAAAVAGTRELVVVVGPAGTGKTTALQPGVEQLRRDGWTVFGVAPSATAADVLRVGTGVDADTLDKLLVEHRLQRPPQDRYNLPPGATVIVDEAAMVSTPRLVELFQLADRQQWRLVLVGDPLQFAAVGRSGMFGHLADHFGSIQLDRVHRFTEPWERKASLALRRGNTDVVQQYEAHGRLHGGTATQMQRQILSAWWQAQLSGERVAMMAPTNQAVIELNQVAQQRRLHAGQLARGGRIVDVGPYRLYEGDVVATRRNDRQLRTDRGHMVKNRDHWTIQHVHPDGRLTVTGPTGTIRLDPDYVHGNVELAYAETSHSNQGRTVDRSLLYLDGPTDTRGIYVPMTRGRTTNQAFVVLQGEETAVDVITQAVARTWIDTPAIAHRQPPAIEPEPRNRPDSGHERRIMSSRKLAGALRRQERLLEQLREPGITSAEHHTTVKALDAMDWKREIDLQHIERSRADFAAAKEVLDRYPRGIDRLLHRRELAQAEKTFDESRLQLRELRRDVRHLDSSIKEISNDLGPRLAYEARRPELQAQLGHVQDVLDADQQGRSQLLDGRDLALIVDHLGPEPEGAAAGELWQDAAGRIAQHRAAFDITDGTLLGAQPSYFTVDAYAISHRAAVSSIDQLDRALGRIPEQVLDIEPLGLSL